METVPALVASLVRLADAPPLLPTAVKGVDDENDDIGDGGVQPKKEEEEGGGVTTAMEVEEEEKLEAAYVKADLTDISRSAASIASRADALRSSLVPLLRTALSSASASVEKLSAADPLLEPAALRRDIAALQNQLGEKDSRMAQLALARDEAAKGEKRVRRGLYRLASGRMKLTDVVKVRLRCVFFLRAELRERAESCVILKYHWVSFICWLLCVAALLCNGVLNPHVFSLFTNHVHRLWRWRMDRPYLRSLRRRRRPWLRRPFHHRSRRHPHRWRLCRLLEQMMVRSIPPRSDSFGSVCRMWKRLRIPERIGSLV